MINTSPVRLLLLSLLALTALCTSSFAATCPTGNVTITRADPPVGTVLEAGRHYIFHAHTSFDYPARTPVQIITKVRGDGSDLDGLETGIFSMYEDNGTFAFNTNGTIAVGGDFPSEVTLSVKVGPTGCPGETASITYKTTAANAVTLNYPTKDVTLQPGKQLTVMWSVRNSSFPDRMVISIKRDSSTATSADDKSWIRFPNQANAGSYTFTLPETMEAGNDWRVWIKHMPSGTVASSADPLSALLLTDGFDYPISDKGYDAEGNTQAVDERLDTDTNGLYPAAPVATPDRHSTDGGPEKWFNLSDVGNYYSHGLHPAEDWNYGNAGDDDGKPVYAVANGIVLFIKPTYSNASTYGYMMGMKHYLPDGDHVYSIYNHITAHTETTGTVSAGTDDFTHQPGAWVKRGTMIGRIADISASHLHFEMRNSNISITGPSSDIYPNDNSRGYYTDTVGSQRTGGMTLEQVQDAFDNMEDDGVIDPSDFIDGHRPGDSSSGGNGIVLPGFGTDGRFQFPKFNTSVAAQAAVNEIARLGIAMTTGVNLASYSAWTSQPGLAAVADDLQSSDSDKIKACLKSLPSGGTDKATVEMVLTGMINASGPPLTNGWLLLTRTTPALSGTYNVNDLRYTKIVDGTTHSIPIRTTAFSNAVTEDIWVYLTYANGTVVTENFTGATTVNVWVKNDGLYDAAGGNAAQVADPGFLTSSVSSSSSDSGGASGCAFNTKASPATGLVALLALGAMLIAVRTRKN